MTRSDDGNQSIDGPLQGKTSHLVVCGGGIMQMFSRKSSNVKSSQEVESGNNHATNSLLAYIQRKNHNEKSPSFRPMLSEIKENVKLNPNPPRRVKVCLYDKVFTPYLVVYNSDNKYAIAIGHLKLSQYDVNPQNNKQFKLTRRVRAQDSGTMKNLNSVIFQAPSEFARDNWVDTLNPLCGKCDEGYYAPFRPKKRLNIQCNMLPVLWEDNEEVEMQQDGKRSKMHTETAGEIII